MHLHNGLVPGVTQIKAGDHVPERSQGFAGVHGSSLTASSFWPTDCIYSSNVPLALVQQAQAAIDSVAKTIGTP